jgi:naphthoate synthase
MAHDHLLRYYLETEESRELGRTFGEKQKPDPDKFGH